MACSLKIQSGIQRTGNAQKWLKKMERNSSGTGNIQWDFTLEDTSKKTILLIDMAYPNENNKIAKRDEKIGKYNRLCFELRERRDGYTVKVVPTIIGCLGGGMKELKESIRQIFEYENNDEEPEWISREMQKTVLWESESLIRKVLSGLLTWGVSI